MPVLDPTTLEPKLRINQFGLTRAPERKGQLSPFSHKNIFCDVVSVGATKKSDKRTLILAKLVRLSYTYREVFIRKMRQCHKHRKGFE